MWKTSVSLCRLGCTLVIVCGAPASASGAPLTLRSDPDVIARQALGDRPGMAAVGVWRAGAASYGGAPSVQPGGPAAAASALFEIGSISKVFTGLLLAQAVERGDLSIDDTLGQLLRGQARLQPWVARVTLRQLITHSSCLPRMPANFPPEDGSNNPYRNYDRAMLWAGLAQVRLEQAGPCDAVYSNMGVAIVGELLAQRYGKPWEVLVGERITGPLGMHDTLQHLEHKAVRLAPGYGGASATSPWDFKAFAGAGSLRSTVADMLLFSRAVMAGKDGPLGAAAERMLRPLGRMDGGEIGYAVMMRGPLAQRAYFHGGATGGYHAEWMILPDTGEALIVMASNNEAPASGIREGILGQRFQLAGTRSAAGDGWPGDYAGVFRVDPHMALTFVAQDGELYGRLTGQAFGVLTPSARDVYVVPNVGAEFSFERVDGKIMGVVLRQRGALWSAKRTDQPAPSLARDGAITPEQFGGHYRVSDPALPPMDFEVRAMDGQLLGRLNDQPMLPVFPVPGKEDRYALDVVAAEFQFERDARRHVNALVLHQNGKAIRAPRVAPAPLKLEAAPVYLRGSMNDWGLRDQLQAVAPGVYAAKVALDKGEYEFKIASQDWSAVDLGGSMARPAVGGEPVALALHGANLRLSVSDTASYEFKVDVSAPERPRLSITAQPTSH